MTGNYHDMDKEKMKNIQTVEYRARGGHNTNKPTKSINFVLSGGNKDHHHHHPIFRC